MSGCCSEAHPEGGTTTTVTSAMDPIENPILNSPFQEPARHFAFDDRGVITGEILESRRRSVYFTPIPGTKKKAGPSPFAGPGRRRRSRRGKPVDQPDLRPGQWVAQIWGTRG